MKPHKLFALVFFSLLTHSLFGQNQREQLQQLNSQLRNSPVFLQAALREKIIAVVLTMNPKPTIPDSVILAEGGAEYAFKHAQNISDFSDAAKQYEKALLIAPWLAVDYFNCGVAHEKAGENKEAILNFNFYLMASPGANDAQDVKKRIGGLQYVMQKAVEEKEKAEKEANSPEAKLDKFLTSLDGRVWKCDHSYVKNTVGGREWTDSYVGHTYIAIKGYNISYFSIYKDYQTDDGDRHQIQNVDYDPNMKPDWTATLTGYQFNGDLTSHPPITTESNIFTISTNGQSINNEKIATWDGGSQKSTVHFIRMN